MKLPVVQADRDEVWYADGLKFTCTQCGNCCTGGPGFVWLSHDEIRRLAEYLKLTPEETVERHCRKIGGRFSLNEVRTPAGQYDCIFLTTEARPESPVTDKSLPPGAIVPLPARGCSIYSVRPLQCRTWPFWPELLKTPMAWDKASRRCHGMDRGRKFPLTQIAKIRDATDWPDRPPTSAPAK